MKVWTSARLMPVNRRALSNSLKCQGTPLALAAQFRVSEGTKRFLYEW